MTKDCPFAAEAGRWECNGNCALYTKEGCDITSIKNHLHDIVIALDEIRHEIAIN